MGRFFDAVKAGLSAVDEPRAYTIAGKPVHCPHCSHQQFVPGRALLNSRGRTLFNLDWTDPAATILVCAECSRIEWFGQEPDEASL